MRWAGVGLLLAAAACAPRVGAVRLGEDLRDRDPAIYRASLGSPETVRAIARIQSTSLAPLLVEALADPAVRADAAWGLGELVFGEYWKDNQAAPFVAALEPHAADADPLVRARVAVALGRLGDEARPRALLPDADPSVRCAALEGIFWRVFRAEAPLEDATVQAVDAASRDGDPEVRWRCAYVFTRRPEPRAAEMLTRLLEDANPWARLFAIRALARIPESDGAIFVRACGDADDGVRTAAVLAVREPGDIPERLYADECVHVRAAVAQKVGALLDDPSPWVRSLGVEAAAKRDGEAFAETLAGFLRDDSVLVRMAAARSVPTARASWRDLWTAAMGDADERVVMEAIGALGSVEDEASVAEIERLLGEGLSVMRLGTAVDAAKEKKQARLVPALVACARRAADTAFVEVREGIADALADLEAWDDVAALADDPAPSVRARARRALADHRGEPVEEPMRAVEQPSTYLGAREARRLVLETDRGRIAIELNVEWAPTHAAAVTALARRGFYDGLTFHRVVSNFVVQGGDPTGTGWGDGGFQLRDEVSPEPYERGTVGMAKAGKDTGSCQLFITHTPTPHLGGQYTRVGRVVEGMDVLDRIEPGDRIVRATVE